MSIRFSFPPSSLFILDQAQIKPTIPTRQLAKLSISTAFYSVTLHLKFPLVATFTYTIVFRHAVILHNMLLALYSALGAITVARTFKNAWPRRHDAFYTVLVADLFCRGGHIVPGGETLQEFVFIGWTSYMSKFYEFIDTAIILAKGQQASLLHIYHHAGVILVSWALVRFEYPPALILFFPQCWCPCTYVQLFIDLIVCPSYLFVYQDIPVDYARCTDYRKIGDASDAPGSRDAGVNGQSYCSIRTVSCMNKASHTSVVWLGITFILSRT
ncbi:GNS1/SUR4 family-domain-containing protein [Aspergillus tamarii]|uniref:Elongation of fatty acids protein n=1 Tax=Aspergillus tamarii TaxID=41984 RepID=A0A5N6UUE3_ASPTM|nr:GNS1/SUR4 family-domain-containing protein [Aspergillus tamarii]